MIRKEVLRLERVTYPAVGKHVLNDISLSIREGEIMGLQPVDTYGLDELIQVTRDNPPLYYGYVYYQEKCVNSWKTRAHGGNRTAFIGSRSSLIEGQSVLMNIFVLRGGFHQELIRKKLLLRQLKPFLDEIDFQIDPDTPVENLSSSERVIVELLRAVIAGYHLIILGEISSFISENERQRIHRILRHYASKGVAFLYLSLHSEEISQLCTRAALLSANGIFMVLEGDQVGIGVGCDYYQEYYNQVMSHVRQHQSAENREYLNVSVTETGILQEFSFSVSRGECLVVQLLEMQLYKDLIRLLNTGGAYRGIEFCVDGKRISGSKDRKILFVPEDSPNQLVIWDMDIEENLCLGMDGRLPQVWLREKLRRSVGREYFTTYGVDPSKRMPDELTDIELIDMICMKILLEKPSAVFIAQPFKGKDVRQRHEVFRMLEQMLKRGIAVVILAVNMADAMTAADRVLRLGSEEGILKQEEYLPQDFGRLPSDIPWLGYMDE